MKKYYFRNIVIITIVMSLMLSGIVFGVNSSETMNDFQCIEKIDKAQAEEIKNNGHFFEVVEKNEKYISHVLEDYEIIIPYYIYYEDECIKLYPEFMSMDEAISKTYNEKKEMLDALKSRYSLGEFNAENWCKYKIAMMKCVNSKQRDEYFNEENLDFLELRSIFNTLDNQSLNIQITQLINENNSKDLLEREDFNELLPVRDEKVENNQIIKTKSLILNDFNNALTLKSSSGYSNSQALKYAKAYAENRNKEYRSYGSDCTNFVSQIMRAGGRTMEISLFPTKGWWYLSNTATGGSSNSYSWSAAHNFVVYFKMYTATSYHSQFSRTLKTGDFIAIDYESDGRIDHMGYVMQVSIVEVTYNGHTYEKYKVAQHTPDYIAWTTSETNGWEKYNGIGTYYIIRP